MSIHQRKADHIRINLEEEVGFDQLTTGLERYRFVHQALPELDLAAVDTTLSLFGRAVAAPILVSSMTGGTYEAQRINRNLAEATQACGLAMGVGSQRASLSGDANAERNDGFDVRQAAPDVLLLANIGAVQLNYGYGVDECRRAVEMIGADALIFHLNPLQEVFQPEGDTNWSGLLAKIEQVCAALDVPVVAKEVGWGISEGTARQLIDAGVAAIDVAGAGGTSWSQVEMHRAPDARRRRLGATFRDWGIPTVESIKLVDRARREEIGEPSRPAVEIFASGGVRSGLDVAKCVALGATLVGLAGPFLKAAAQSTEAVIEEMTLLREELTIAMFCSGAGELAALREAGRLREVE